MSAHEVTIENPQSPYHPLLHVSVCAELYSLSLHDALPICSARLGSVSRRRPAVATSCQCPLPPPIRTRSEEHTSELQSRGHLVCRLLLEKKNNKNNSPHHHRVR